MTLGITTKMLDLGRSRQREIQKQGAERAEGTGVDMAAGLQVANGWHVRLEQLDVQGGEWKEINGGG